MLSWSQQPHILSIFRWFFSGRAFWNNQEIHRFPEFQRTCSEKKNATANTTTTLLESTQNRCKVQTNHLPSDPHRAGRRFKRRFEKRAAFGVFQPLNKQTWFLRLLSSRSDDVFFRSEGSPESFLEAWESKQKKIYIYIIYMFFITGAKEWQVCRFRRSIQRSEDDI